MHSSAFPAQLEITCSARGCHLESGKPIYFPPQIGLVVLVRCRKPINHQRGLRVSISQEACHLPDLDPQESRQQAGRGRGAVGAERAGPRTPGGSGRGPANVRSSEGRRRCTPPPPPHALPLALKFHGSGWRVGRPVPRAGALIFPSRPQCSSFGGNGSCKGSSGRPPLKAGGVSHPLPCPDMPAGPSAAWLKTR